MSAIFANTFIAVIHNVLTLSVAIANTQQQLAARERLGRTCDRIRDRPLPSVYASRQNAVLGFIGVSQFWPLCVNV